MSPESRQELPVGAVRLWAGYPEEPDLTRGSKGTRSYRPDPSELPPARARIAEDQTTAVGTPGSPAILGHGTCPRRSRLED